MTVGNPAPPLDPECGGIWRTISESMFEGRGPRVDADSLEATRNFELSTREALLEGRPYSHRELQLPGPAGDLVLSVFTPDALAAPGPAVYWVHGGGMVAGSRFGASEGVDAGAAVGAVITSVEYRLAPEHPAPAPADDCYAGLLWVAEHADELGIDPARVVLGGASAGGGLAAATALRVRDHGGPALAGLMLCCPMLDDRMTSCSSDQFDDVILWTRASNEFGWRSLLGDRFGTDEVTIYEVPGRATDLAGLPPTWSTWAARTSSATRTWASPPPSGPRAATPSCTCGPAATTASSCSLRRPRCRSTPPRPAGAGSPGRWSRSPPDRRLSGCGSPATRPST
jgi:acetyl esterase/lipase